MNTIILISGGTASGKTTITKAIAQQIDALVISHDRYYKDISNPIGHNFDEPEALDNHLLVQDIHLLKNGQPALLPIYHFPTHRRQKEKELVYPKKIIIVEGILTFACPELFALGDLSVFVDAPDDIRLARRLQRDVIERGRDVKGVLQQYLNTVRPMHNLYVKPLRSKASLLLDGCQPIEENLKIFFLSLHSFMQKEKNH